MQVHYFESSGEAYDACQVNNSIEDGDVLVVPSEKVVGVLVGAWPVAVFGEGCKDSKFHGPPDDWRELSKDRGVRYDLSCVFANTIDFSERYVVRVYPYMTASISCRDEFERAVPRTEPVAEELWEMIPPRWRDNKVVAVYSDGLAVEFWDFDAVAGSEDEIRVRDVDRLSMLDGPYDYYLG